MRIKNEDETKMKVAQLAGAAEYTDHPCREEKLPPRVSWIFTIWWWSSRNAKYPFIAIAPRSTLAGSGGTWWGPINKSNRSKLCTNV